MGNNLRIYSIIRKDLEMSVGKLAAMACHASRTVALLAAQQDPELLRLYQGPDFLGTQIVLEANNEYALRKAYAQAKKAGLITSLIIDSGHVMLPHFDGSPVVAALGIGPCTKEQACFTKKFQLVP